MSIITFDVPRTTVAKLAGLHLPDVSAWLNGGHTVSEAKVARISEIVLNLEKALGLYRIKFDLRDPDNVKKLLSAVKNAETEIECEDSSLSERAWEERYRSLLIEFIK